MSKIYIVMVNYNTFSDTIECLESVLKSSYTDFQIFVIDNSLNDNSIQQLLRWANGSGNTIITTNFEDLVLPTQQKPLNYAIITEDELGKGDNLHLHKITFIRAKNNGFAAANNIALKYVLKNGEADSLIWILNNDTVVEKDTLSKLVNFQQQHKYDKYLLGAKLRYYYKPATLQAIAGNYNIWIGKHEHIGEGETDHGQYDSYKPKKGDYIVGASIFLPKLFIEQAGLMCEDYFLYFEELDWLRAGAKCGFTMAIVPDAVIYHKEGASIIGDKNKKKDTSLAEYYSISNRVRFINKWHPFQLITVMPGVILALLKRIIKGKFDLVKKTSVTLFKILFKNNNPSKTAINQN